MRLRIDDVTGALYSEDPFSVPGLRQTADRVLYGRRGPSITPESVVRPRYGRSPYESAQRPKETP